MPFPENELLSYLKVPEFKSKVPENARRVLNEDARWLADTLSILDQRNEWMCDRLLETYTRAIKTEAQVAYWRSKLEWPITSTIAILALIIPTLLSWFLKKVLP